MGHCAGLQCPVPNLAAPKGPSFYPKRIMLQFQICYHSHLNISQKMKTNINLWGHSWVRPSAKCWVKGFILPHGYHTPNLYRRLWLTLTKNEKTNNNIAGYHLVSHHVISIPSDLQCVYRCSKKTFILPKKISCFSFNFSFSFYSCLIVS